MVVRKRVHERAKGYSQKAIVLTRRNEGEVEFSGFESIIIELMLQFFVSRREVLGQPDSRQRQRAPLRKTLRFCVRLN